MAKWTHGSEIAFKTGTSPIFLPAAYPTSSCKLFKMFGMFFVKSIFDMRQISVHGISRTGEIPTLTACTKVSVMPRPVYFPKKRSETCSLKVKVYSGSALISSRNFGGIMKME